MKTDEKTVFGDGEIVEGLRNRDQSALVRLSEKYGAFIYTVCFGLLGSAQDSEECKNETLFKMWNAIPPADPKDLKAFAASVARKTSVDRFRAEHRKKRIGQGLIYPLDDFAGSLADDRSVVDEAEAAELASILNAFLQTLSEKERVCFVQNVYFGSAPPQIAKKTGIPRSSVYALLKSVKERLKTKLNEEGYLT